MIINRVIIGNKEEAVVENRFKTGLNIISSDDNNKGKTLVIQSMMYALGNDPIFPSSFEYKNYYHIVDFSIEGQMYSICRKTDSFVVLHSGNMSIFDSLSEFKYFLSKVMFKLPKILKDGFVKVVDPVLFYQIFFVGQDKKDTSNIFNSGYYNKNDFINMLFSYYGIDYYNSDFDADEIKKNIDALKLEKKEIQKQNKILKSSFSAVSVVSMANDLKRFEEKIKEVEKVKNAIVDLNSKRNAATSRKIKNEITLKELRSLNNSISAGELRCLDCNSPNIGYSTADKSYTFDISSVDIRNQILTSIEDKISAYNEEIQYITSQINEKQQKLQELLLVEEISLEALLLHKNELVNASDADERLMRIEMKLKELMQEMEVMSSGKQDQKDKQDELISNILDDMNSFYKKLDPEGNMKFESLFTKKQLVYSGSEGAEFYLSKLFALLKILKHEFPIIMDYFRDGELSSYKENIAINEFSKVKNQVIFTVTLKKEELGKYDNDERINHIDYSGNTPCKLLSESFNRMFTNEMKRFAIKL